MKAYARAPERHSTLNAIELATPEAFWFEGAREDKANGWLLKSANYVQGKEYAVAFLVHGGSQIPFRDS